MYFFADIAFHFKTFPPRLNCYWKSILGSSDDWQIGKTERSGLFRSLDN